MQINDNDNEKKEIPNNNTSGSPGGSWQQSSTALCLPMVKHNTPGTGMSLQLLPL